MLSFCLLLLALFSVAVAAAGVLHFLGDHVGSNSFGMPGFHARSC